MINSFSNHDGKEMKKSLCVFLILLVACKSNPILQNKNLRLSQPSLTIETLMEEPLSIRAILIDKNKVWFAANKNKWGYYDLKQHKKVVHTIDLDQLHLEFRSIAQTKESVFILSIGNPAILIKINKLDLSYQVVYKEIHENVFYDSMQFWNDKEGIAIGDPIEDCFATLFTRDGGTTWQKRACSELPKLEQGEAAFAASNTSICIKGRNTFVVSGGKKASVLVSSNKGKTWRKFTTPIVQGQTMTGIFSADFYTKNLGFIVGGNYENPLDNNLNKALTLDGGVTWNLKATNKGFGYASCVQFIPGSNGEKLVTVGSTGIYYSGNRGEDWIKLSNESELYSIRFQDKKTAYGSGKNKLLQIKFEY